MCNDMGVLLMRTKERLESLEGTVKYIRSNQDALQRSQDLRKVNIQGYRISLDTLLELLMDECGLRLERNSEWSINENN